MKKILRNLWISLRVLRYVFSFLGVISNLFLEYFAKKIENNFLNDFTAHFIKIRIVLRNLYFIKKIKITFKCKFIM